MTDASPSRRELRHDLGNERQQTTALKSLLRKAAAELQQLSESDCNTEERERAMQVVDRIRIALGDQQRPGD